MKDKTRAHKFYLPCIAMVTLMVFSFAYPIRGEEQEQGGQGTFLLTIFLKHDQSKTLDQIQAELRRTGFTKNFPPEGVNVVSWYVMMGIGQVVTLRVPAEKLRDVNLAIERGAWGAFRSEFYATYDYRPVWESERKKSQ